MKYRVARICEVEKTWPGGYLGEMYRWFFRPDIWVKMYGGVFCLSYILVKLYRGIFWVGY